MFIDKARQMAEDLYYTESKKNEKLVEVVPVGIYTQLVNGFNYKIIQAIRDIKTNELELYEYVFYNKPYESNGQLELTRAKKMVSSGPLLYLSNEPTQLDIAVGKYFGIPNGKNYINSLVAYPNSIPSLKIMVATVTLGGKERKCVVLDEDGEISVVADFRAN